VHQVGDYFMEVNQSSRQSVNVV